jgi:hypothetical protein
MKAKDLCPYDRSEGPAFVPANGPTPANGPVPANGPKRRGSGVWRLTIAVGLIATVWLGVLPQLARVPAIRQQIDRNADYKINADAMFYSEVGPVEGIRLRVVDGEIVREPILMGSEDQ